MLISMIGVKRAAEEYGIGRNRIYTAIRTGELKAYRPDCRSFILKREEFEAWITGHPYRPREGRRE